MRQKIKVRTERKVQKINYTRIGNAVRQFAYVCKASPSLWKAVHYKMRTPRLKLVGLPPNYVAVFLRLLREPITNSLCVRDPLISIGTYFKTPLYPIHSNAYIFSHMISLNNNGNLINFLCNNNSHTLTMRNQRIQSKL